MVRPPVSAVCVIVGFVLAVLGLGFHASEGSSGRTDATQGYAGDECVEGPPNPYAGPIEYEMVDLPSMLSSIGAGLPVTLPFFHRDYQMQLNLWSDIVDAGATWDYMGVSGLVSQPLTSMVYRGYLTATPSTQVIFGITPDWISGFVVDSDGIYYLEMNPAPGIGTPYISFRLDTTQYQSCGTGAGDPGPGPTGHAPVQSILLYADVEYRDRFWWCPYPLAPEACAMLTMVTDFATTINQFDLYPDVTVVIGQVLIHTIAHRGGLTSLDPTTLLLQLRNDAVAHVQNCAGGICSPNFRVTHLFSAKNFNGITIGQWYAPL